MDTVTAELLTGLLKQLPPLQVFGYNGRIVEVSPLFAADLEPKEMQYIVEILGAVLRMAAELSETSARGYIGVTDD